MTQLEALRLADMLENNYPLEPEAEEAAAGLRRLHEENEHLRQALLQPEQRPVGTYEGVMETMLSLRKGTLEQQQIYTHMKDKLLYTAPPKRERSEQREWVGLTDEEAREISFNLPIKWTGHLQGAASIYDFARAIEAKLKEKNT